MTIVVGALKVERGTGSPICLIGNYEKKEEASSAIKPIFNFSLLPVIYFAVL